MPELVIFDCDGVLVDSEKLATRVDVEFLAGLGWAMTEAEAVERFVSQLVPVQGIVEALSAIRHETGVASSGTHDKIKFSLSLVGLYERFAGRIFSATEVSRGKPAPDLFLHAAQRMRADPGQCVVIEDSRSLAS